MEVPFFRVALENNEIDAVVSVLRSGWLTTGSKADEFEKAFAAALGGNVGAVAVNSATAGLHLALEALGIGPGDEVICPTLTFTATAEVIRYLGADVVLVDIDPVSRNIGINAIRDAITPATRAIMPVHFGGLSCNMDAIIELASEYDLKVIEDAAHAYPSTYKGKPIGTLGTDATVFSFYANKTMTTGEGGMLVSSNSALLDRARTMRTHGIDRDAFSRFIDHNSPWRYDIVAPGFKYNMTDIAAALGLTQLFRAQAMRESRERLARRYDAELAKLPLFLPPSAGDKDVHSWHLYSICVSPDSPLERDALISKLRHDGIGTSVHYIPLHAMSYWRDRYNLAGEKFPHASAYADNAISLPLFPDMTDSEQTHVIDRINYHLGKGKDC